MISGAVKYLPEVAWRTICRQVFLLSQKDSSNDAIYRLNVFPIDVNDLGAATLELEVGFYLKDYVGHTYRIVNVNGLTIDVSDDFECGEAPQSGQHAIVYKSVYKGNSPYLAPIFYRHLDRMAFDYSRRFELDILWRNTPRSDAGQLTAGLNFVTFNEAFGTNEEYVLWLYTYNDEGVQVGNKLVSEEKEGFEVNVPISCNYRYIATTVR